MFDLLNNVKIAVIGDFCIDVYWYADMTKSELSRETPHFPLPVQREVMSPGAAGNVANNIAALKIEKLYALGVVGNDWRGKCLKDGLSEAGIDVSGLISAEGRFTNAYIKPMKMGISETVMEDARIDFEADSPLERQTEDALIAMLEEISTKIDVLCVCDQMKYGCITERVRAKICELGKNGLTVIVDSRDRIGLYENVTVKPNDLEAARATGYGSPSECAEALCEKNGKSAIVTCGKNGCIVCENGKCTRVPAIEVKGEIDICGAGDTFLSALACFKGAGLSFTDAAAYANAASSVTIKKIRMTGTATREELHNAIEANK